MNLLRDSDIVPHPGLDIQVGDVRKPLQLADYDVVLLANLLHLFGPDDNKNIVHNAVRSVKPGGAVIIKDILISPNRTGPRVGLYFALNMALYTNAGDLYSVPTLESWMSDAGLTDIKTVRIPRLDDTVIVVGARPKG